MTRYSADTLLQGWKAGKTLNEAVELFDPQLDNDRLAKWENQIRSSAAIGRRNFEAIGIEAHALIDALEQVQLRLSSASEARVSEERQLLTALENGELIAIGYATGKGAAAKPELVPAFLFQRQFAKFGKSEFSDGEYRFAKVRIAPPSAFGKSKIGRPSIREYVFQIAAAIEDRIRNLKPGEQVAQVHRHGLQKFPQTFTKNSPTPRAIARHLKSYWHSN